MTVFNPPPPEKPTDAFLRWVERRTGLVIGMQSAEALERLRVIWEAERKGER